MKNIKASFFYKFIEGANTYIVTIDFEAYCRADRDLN